MQRDKIPFQVRVKTNNIFEENHGPITAFQILGVEQEGGKRKAIIKLI